VLLALATMEAGYMLPPDECRAVMFVHDSLVFECREDLVGRYSRLIKHQMENPPLKQFGISLAVPLVADVKVGPNRGELVPVDFSS
jgi:DNA polymerase I-like protein with 3'-5' exonuclease and polymerase domains